MTCIFDCIWHRSYIVVRIMDYDTRHLAKAILKLVHVFEAITARLNATRLPLVTSVRLSRPAGLHSPEKTVSVQSSGCWGSMRYKKKW